MEDDENNKKLSYIGPSFLGVGDSITNAIKDAFDNKLTTVIRRVCIGIIIYESEFACIIHRGTDNYGNCIAFNYAYTGILYMLEKSENHWGVLKEITFNNV